MAVTIQNAKRPKGYKVAPLSGAKLAALATDIVAMLRVQGCYPDGGYRLDGTQLLESVLFRAGYTFHVVSDAELEDAAAFTIPERNIIVLRESVYDGLAKENPFSISTVVHEFAHIFLNHAVTLHRGAALGGHEWYEDSEWQANNLTAEILMPEALVEELGYLPLLVQEACGVSSQAAQYRVVNLKKRKGNKKNA